MLYSHLDPENPAKQKQLKPPMPFSTHKPLLKHGLLTHCR
jgi:hypothetical protein